MSSGAEFRQDVCLSGPIGLSDWLAPLSATEFMSHYWDRRELRWQSPGAHLPFTLQDFDALLSSGGLVYPQVNVLGGAGVVAPSTYTATDRNQIDARIDGAAVLAWAREGRTIRLRDVGTIHGPARQLRTRLERIFSGRISINAYYCCGPAEGIGYHRDAHHLFVLQLEGTKQWRIGSDPERRAKSEGEAGLSAPGIAVRVVTLNPGDILYLPPGTWHVTETESISLHASVGIHQPTWAECLHELIEQARQHHTILDSHLPFHLAEDTCVMRTDVREELRLLIGLLSREVPADVSSLIPARKAEVAVLLPRTPRPHR